MTDPIQLPCPPPRRPRGGQYGNRSTLKHGFYARTYLASDVKDIETYTFQGLQDEIAARVVIGLTVALNTTLRTQLELDLHGGSEFDASLKAALQSIAEELSLNPPGR